MALSTMRRLGSSSILLSRFHSLLFFPDIAASRPSSRRVFVELPPLSGASRLAVRTVSSKGSDREEESFSAARLGEGDDRSGRNGGLMVEERSGAQEGMIIPAELPKEAKEAYVAYAMSVLVGRALPDVRDGLKPVHRRILYAMHELGLSSRKPFKKCARVVGEVLGKFHPHGDTAVYNSLVRMAQDFSLRCPLIRGHGNFGSIDADPPAAMRYTECRLELTKRTRTRIPNLLLNGSSGIAVGMATNIPPHNLGELVDALSALIHNPEATFQELLEYMPGPDFPTGGIILEDFGILEAYKTGRGRIVVRGKIDVEILDDKGKRSAIIIKEVIFAMKAIALEGVLLLS